MNIDRCCGISVNIANNPMGRHAEEILEAVLTRVPDLLSLNCSHMKSPGSHSLLAFIPSLNRHVIVVLDCNMAYTSH